LEDEEKLLLMEEFVREGDIRLVLGFVYEGDCMGDRNKLNKKESFLVFVEKICFPILNALDHVCEDFDSNTVQMQMNLRHWKPKVPQLDED
jgi:hypothetical protein